MAVKELPHDLLAEKSLVGCLIIDGTAIDDIADLKLSKDDFYDPKMGIIFNAIKDLYQQNMPIDYVTVCSRLNDGDKLEQLGGQSFITEIVDDQATAANVYHYAKTVKDKSSMRRIVKTASKVAEKGLQYDGLVADFIQEVETSFLQLTGDAKHSGMLKLNECIKQNLKELDDNARKKGEISGFPTGFKKLDELLLGMQAGQLLVIAARPAMGKTAFALNIAVNVCEETQFPVAIFSLEMVAQELSMRVLSSKAKVNSRKIKAKDFLDTDLRSLGMAAQTLAKLPIFIEDSGQINLLDIQSQSRKIKAEHGLGLVIIDYLQLMTPHTNTSSREQQIAEISRGLKAMAKELECPVIALSQLNRGVEQRPNKRPSLSDLRESGSIEQDADVVMMIYRDEVYDPNSKDLGIAEIIVVKNRSGEVGTAKLSWVGAYTSFGNLAYRESIPEGMEARYAQQQ